MKVTILINPTTNEIIPFISEKTLTLEIAIKEFLLREQGTRRAEQKIQVDADFNKDFIKANAEGKILESGFWCTKVDESTANIYLVETKTIAGWLSNYQQNEKKLYKVLKIMNFDIDAAPSVSPFKLFEKEKSIVQLELKNALVKRRKAIEEH